MPLNRSLKVAIIGTSLCQHNTLAQEASGTVVRLSNWSRGWMTWARTLDPRITFVNWPNNSDPNGRGFTGANHGVSGQTYSQIEPRVPDVVAMKPDICFVDVGTNDMVPQSKEDIQAARERICATLVAGGVQATLLPILGRLTNLITAASGTNQNWSDDPFGGPSTLYARRKAHWINERSRAHASATEGVYWFDWNNGWIDPTDAFGQPCAGWSDDGTHFAPRGGICGSQRVGSLSGSDLSSRPADVGERLR